MSSCSFRALVTHHKFSVIIFFHNHIWCTLPSGMFVLIISKMKVGLVDTKAVNFIRYSERSSMEKNSRPGGYFRHFQYMSTLEFNLITFEFKRRKKEPISDCNRTRTYNHFVRKWTLNYLDKWLLVWVFVNELSGCGFESCCSHINFRYGTCFKQWIP